MLPTRFGYGGYHVYLRTATVSKRELLPPICYSRAQSTVTTAVFRRKRSPPNLLADGYLQA
eukprot:843670-Prorocentrum_minimum.AAC.1